LRSVHANNDILTIEESKSLIKLCQAGKLYDLEKWIASGKSLRTPPEAKKSILSVAATTEFHSLIELIVRHESDQTIRNAALAQAVAQRQRELVELLLRYGADLTSIPLLDVLRCWDPKRFGCFWTTARTYFRTIRLRLPLVNGFEPP